jgi:hypothetical protein
LLILALLAKGQPVDDNVTGIQSNQTSDLEVRSSCNVVAFFSLRPLIMPSSSFFFTFFFTFFLKCVPGAVNCALVRWKDGQRPPLNLQSPPRKDTVTVPPGGYAVVRLITDNPGMWHLHCHMQSHLFFGMSLVLQVLGPDGSAQPFPPPPGFPTCGNFDSSREFVQRSRKAFDNMVV